MKLAHSHLPEAEDRAFLQHDRPTTRGSSPTTPFPLRPLTSKERTPRNCPSRSQLQGDKNHLNKGEKTLIVTNPWETNLGHTVPRPSTAAADLARSTPNKRFTASRARSVTAPKLAPLYATKLGKTFTEKKGPSEDMVLFLDRLRKKEEEERAKRRAKGYEEMVDVIGTHRLARESLAQYARLLEEERVRYYEQWLFQSFQLDQAKLEMRRWGTSGTDIMHNAIQRQMARSFEPPKNEDDDLAEFGSQDAIDEKYIKDACRTSYATGMIEIIWGNLHTIHPCIRCTMMLQVHNLVSLRLPGNSLQRLPLWFCKIFHHIRDLHLGSNELKELPLNLGDMTALVELNICHNLVTELPRSIGQLTRLARLDCSDNELSSVAEQIGSCFNLVEANFDSNNLLRLPANIRKLQMLRRLRIEGNRIGTLALIPSLARLKPNAMSPSDMILWEYKELKDGRVLRVHRFTGEYKTLEEGGGG